MESDVQLLLRDARFTRFLAAQVISRAGSAIAPVALAFAVLGVDPAPSGLAVVLAANTMPQLVVLLAGGVLADRLPRGPILVVSNLGAGATQGAVVVLIVTGTASTAAVATLAAVLGATAAFAQPAQQGVVPQLVEVEQLQQANALLRLPVNAVRVAAPALGGALVAVAGPAWALGIDAASFVVAATLVTNLRLPRVQVGGRFLEQLRTGWRAFRATTWIWVYTAAGTVVVAAFLGGYALLGPIAAAHYYGGAAAWGLVQGGFALGLVGGSAVALRIPATRPVVVASVGSVPLAFPLLALGLNLPLPYVVGAAALAGIGQDIASVAWQTALGHHLPTELIGRVTSWTVLGELAAVPLGYIVVGAAAGAAGVLPLLLGGSIVLAAACLAPLAAPSVRGLRGPAAT